MPEVTLDVVSMDAAPLPVARSLRFDGLGGTIGRDEANTLVLQDKHRRVSRLHASITFPNGIATITNASTSLPISVGGQLLSFEQKLPLTEGVLVEIGPYLLKAREAAGATAISPARSSDFLDPALFGDATVGASLGQSAPMSTPPASPLHSLHKPVREQALPAAKETAPIAAAPGFFAVPIAPQVDDSDPFASLLAGIGPSAAVPMNAFAPDSSRLPSVDDPFAGLLSPAPVRPDPVVQAPLYANQHSSQPAAIHIPEDFNPFDLPSVTSRNSADPLAQMLGGGSAQSTANPVVVEPSIDALFSPSAGSPFDGLSGGQMGSPFSAPGVDLLAPAPDNSDPFLMFGDSYQSPSDQIRQPVRDDLPEIGGAFQPPRAFTPGPAMSFADRTAGVVESRSSQQSAGFAASPDALTEAFLRGAGLPAGALPNGLTPEAMAVVGGMLRAATAGAIDMLAARAATKLEVQAAVTIISAQANNPLKFSPTAEVALQQMLGKKMPGFMRADEAMRDAFDDLRAHEIGVIAGTRAALTEVLGRFDPTALAARLSGGGLIENLLPSIRKTKLWEIYLERYAQIRREAEDDFQSIFGRSFLQAYENETARVKAQTTEFGKQP
jgi:FHA domain-containing protein